MQQFRIELCCTLERCEQPPQALGFVFFVADGIVLLLCQLADQASGSVLIEWLCIQNVIQLGLRIRMYRYRCLLRQCDTLRLFCQPAKQARDLLLDFRRRRLGADPLKRFLRRRSLRHALLGLTFCGCRFK